MELSSLFYSGPSVTAPVEGLVFPGTCCGCGRETHEHREFTGPAENTIRGVLGQFAGLSSTLTVTIPFCAGCRAALMRRQGIWLAVGLALGIALGVGLDVTMAPERVFGGGFWPVAIRASALVGLPILGAVGGWYRGGRSLPVRLRDYSEREGTVKIRFRLPEYRREFEELLEARQSMASGTLTRGRETNRMRRARKRRG